MTPSLSMSTMTRGKTMRRHGVSLQSFRPAGAATLSVSGVAVGGGAGHE
jgi:hypothetical protein